MKTLEEKKKERQKRLDTEETWDIWEDETIQPWRPKDAPKHIAAPKRDLPIHAESYNPPEEYLLDDEEKDSIYYTSLSSSFIYMWDTCLGEIMTDTFDLGLGSQKPYLFLLNIFA